MADYGLAAQVGAGGGGGMNAMNPVQTMAQLQGMNNAMLQGQAFQQQMAQQNALRNILAQSGGKMTPQTIQGLLASGNYEPALAIQRHQATMTNLGTESALRGVQLQEAKLGLGEKQREVASNTAMINYIAKTPNIADPEKLDALRNENPVAWSKVRKHIEDMREATAKADKEGRAALVQGFDLTKKSLGFVERLLPSINDQQSFSALRNYVLSYGDKNLATVIGPEFTPENLMRLKNVASSTDNMETKELPDGRYIAINKGAGTYSFITPEGMQPGGKLSDLQGGAGATTTAAAPVAPPVAPVAPTPGMAPGITASMNATNAMPQTQAPAPAQAPANAMVQPPVDPLAAIKAQADEKKRQAELANFRQQEEIKAELNPKGQLTEEQMLKLQKDVGNELADTRNTLAALNDTIKAAQAVKSLSPGAKESITGPINARMPSTTQAALDAETKLENLKGIVTRLGKEAASAGGAIGNMAVQEWKIVQNMIASLDTTKMNASILDKQIEAIVTKAEAAAKRTREAYNTTYKHAFEKFPGRFDLDSGGNPSDIDALLDKYLKK